MINVANISDFNLFLFQFHPLKMLFVYAVMCYDNKSEINYQNVRWFIWYGTCIMKGFRTNAVSSSCCYQCIHKVNPHVYTDLDFILEMNHLQTLNIICLQKGRYSLLNFIKSYCVHTFTSRVILYHHFLLLSSCQRCRLNN